MAVHRSARNAPAPRRLSAAALARLRRELGATSAALPFAGAVALQRAHPLGVTPAPDAEERAVEEVVSLLLACEGRVAGAPDLAREPALLAALFQNVDLLYEAGYPYADAVSARVMAALE